MRSVEISLKEILVYVLYKWLPILLCALIVGGFMGGDSYLQQPRGAGLEKMKEDFAWKETTTNASIIDLENKIVDAEASIEALRVSNTFTNKKIARIYADLVFGQNDTRVDSIIYTYNNIFITYISLENIFKGVFATDYSEAYLRRVISLTFQKADGIPGRMVITAIGGDELDPEILAEKFYQYLVTNNAMFVQHSGAHSLVEVDRSVNIADESQTLYSDTIVKTYAQIDNYKNQIITMQETLNAERSRLGTPNQLIANRAILGFVIGFIIAIIGAAFLYVIALPIVIPEQIHRRLGVSYVGGYRKKRRSTWLADRVSGRFLISDNRVHAVEYAGSNMREKVAGKKNILITGSIAKEDLQSFADKLATVDGFESINIIASSNVNEDLVTVKLLSQVEAVLLVESMYKSKLTDVMHQADRIHASNIDLVGYVLY